MQYAQVQVLPPTPPGGVTAGIDWATADHAACVVDEAGKVRSRFSAVHDRDGIRKLVAGLRAAGAAEVAIERGEGILVGALLAAGLTVVVITSRQVKNLRSRYGSAGAKDDRFDAFVLADVLRTDRARLRPLVPDSPATLALRAAVRARRDLVAHRIAACNQLRAHLNASFPAGAGLFSELDSPISLAFLSRFCTQDAADLLSEDDLATWLKTLPNRGRTSGPGQLLGRLRAAPAGAAGADGAAPGCRHQRPGRHPDHAGSPGQDPGNRDRGPARRPPRRLRLHQPAAGGHAARGPAAGRDRRLPAPVPRP
jgi:transposase